METLIWWTVSVTKPAVKQYLILKVATSPKLNLNFLLSLWCRRLFRQATLPLILILKKRLANHSQKSIRSASYSVNFLHFSNQSINLGPSLRRITNSGLSIRVTRYFSNSSFYRMKIYPWQRDKMVLMFLLVAIKNKTFSLMVLPKSLERIGRCIHLFRVINQRR